MRIIKYLQGRREEKAAIDVTTLSPINEASEAQAEAEPEAKEAKPRAVAAEQRAAQADAYVPTPALKKSRTIYSMEV